jgi:hypothetical protein
MEKEALGALALRVDSAADADALFRAHGVRSRIRENDLERLIAIMRGELPAGEDALSYGEAEERRQVRAGWGLAATGLFLPFIQIWSVPFAVSAWNRGFKFHAIGIVFLAFALLTLDIYALMHHPEGVNAFRLLVGAGITTVIGLAKVWRGLARGSQR